MGRIEIGSTLGNYRILAPLGAGGMGEVYRALDNTLLREIALKVLPEALAENAVALERFQREAQLLASVTHPNIATIHGLHVDAGVRFLTMELVEGLTLTDRMAARGFERDAALRTAAQIARALEAAHGRGIVHRDLKPGNVMISSAGEIKILDFGLAKALDLPGAGGARDDAPTEGLTLTTEGTALGTVPYMSPEQVRGQAVDARADIWAFGCVLFEMLSGKRTFERTSMLDTAAAVLERDPPWEQLPQDLPDTIRALLVRCLQKDRGRRLHAIADARIEIEDSLGMTPVPVVDRGGLRPLGAPASTLNYLDSVGDYVVVEKLGAGAFGEVYRAWDRVRERDVALKVLKPEAVGDATGRDRLQREAAALSDMQHPNIAALVEFGSHDGLDFLARELVVGDPLTTRLAKGPLSQTEALPILRQVGAALLAAHESGVVHRDLKPGNILVTSDGVVKLVDFGLAGKIDSAAGRGDDSTTGEWSGPLQYCPPEVLGGAAPNDRSDLYTLGVVAYQMLTGLRPFQAATADALSRAICEDAPRPLREVRVGISAAVERLVLRLLSKDPAARGTVPEAIEALDTLRASTSVSGLAASPSVLTGVGQNVEPQPSRRVVPWTLAAIAAVAVTVLVVVVWQGSSRRGDTPVGATPAVIDSLIVVPASVQASDDADAFLADALPALLTGYLSDVDGLETKVPPSSVDYAAIAGDVGKVGKLYGVSAALLPAVTIQGDRVGLTLQLLRPADGGVLWGQVYEGRRDAFFELTRTAADDLRRALRPGSGGLGTAAGATPISDSDLALQRGLHYSSVYRNRLRSEDLDRALVEFEEALRLDPTNARAAAGLAMLHLSRMASGAPVIEVAPEMKRWADRALEIDPRSSNAWAVLSTLEPGRDRDSYRRKLEYALKAAAFGPRNGYAHTCLSAALSTNSNELALVATRQAARIEPLRQTGILYEAVALITVEQIAAGLDRINEALANEPDQPFALMTRALVLARAGRAEEGVAEAAALERFVRERRLHPAWVAYARDYTGYIAAVERGEQGAPATNEMLERLIATARGDAPFPRWENITRGVSNLLARGGERDAAIALLRARHDKGIHDTLDFLMFHSDLASIRDDDRLEQIVLGAGERFDKMVEILADARERAEYPDYLEQPVADLLGRVRRARRDS